MKKGKYSKKPFIEKTDLKKKNFFFKNKQKKKTYSNEKKTYLKKMWFVFFFQTLNLHPNKQK
jgi:hypothetical protein